MPGSGSDFVTAPELSPLFGRAVAGQVGQVLAAGGWGGVMEFGAGSGALAEAVLDALGDAVADYTIVDLSGTLRARQTHLVESVWIGHVAIFNTAFCRTPPQCIEQLARILKVAGPNQAYPLARMAVGGISSHGVVGHNAAFRRCPAVF
jgi:hypothetical protein